MTSFRLSTFGGWGRHGSRMISDTPWSRCFNTPPWMDHSGSLCTRIAIRCENRSFSFVSLLPCGLRALYSHCSCCHCSCPRRAPACSHLSHPCPSAQCSPSFLPASCGALDALPFSRCKLRRLMWSANVFLSRYLVIASAGFSLPATLVILTSPLRTRS